MSAPEEDSTDQEVGGPSIPGSTSRTGSVRGSSTSSINSLRRRRREDKSAEGSQGSHSGHNVNSPTERAIDISDSESLDGRQARTSHIRLPEEERSSISSGLDQHTTADFTNLRPNAHDSALDTNRIMDNIFVHGNSNQNMRVPVRDSVDLNSQSTDSALAPLGQDHNAPASSHPDGYNLDGSFVSAPIRSRARSSISMEDLPVHSHPPPPIAHPARDIVLPRWQPDAEVTFCPICLSHFS
jgi:hypothetical protein